MTNLLMGILAAAVATNQPDAISNLVKDATGISVPAEEFADPVERELDQLVENEKAANADVDRWIEENNRQRQAGAALKPEILNAKIMARFDPVKKAYKDFMATHPTNSQGIVLYGTFLEHLGDEDGAIALYEKAREVNPKNPAAWNQAANYYGHRGPVTNAFAYYAKAIELDTNEPLYYQNMATTVYLFRKDAMEYYHIDEQEVFNKALALYKQAMRADPENFELAQDVAQTYYGIHPPRYDEALDAWTNAMKLAENDLEREGVEVHYARVNFLAGRLDEAQKHVNLVTNSFYGDLKNRIQRNILAKKAELQTNTIPLPSASGPETNAPGISLTAPPVKP